MWLRHVSLSKTASGTFFRETRPGSEMASQNYQKWHVYQKRPKITKRPGYIKYVFIQKPFHTSPILFGTARLVRQVNGPG